MRECCWLITLVLLSGPQLLYGQTGSHAAPAASELGFLKPGLVYLIGFSQTQPFFVHSEQGITTSYSIAPDGSRTDETPTPYKMSLRCSTFRVIEVGSGPWARLEYPIKSKDYAAWNGKHRAQFLLSKRSSNPRTPERLKNLQAAADRKIPTIQSWVNLNYAVRIAEVSAESLGITPEE